MLDVGDSESVDDERTAVGEHRVRQNLADVRPDQDAQIFVALELPFCLAREVGGVIRSDVRDEPVSIHRT